MRPTLRPPRTLGVPGRALDLLAGFILGAAFVYLLDRGFLRAPRRGAYDAQVDDVLLLERVRNALSLTIADPMGIDLRVHDGAVILKGPATEQQIGEMVACASRVRGVRQVENRLSPAG